MGILSVLLFIEMIMVVRTNEVACLEILGLAHAPRLAQGVATHRIVYETTIGS